MPPIDADLGKPLLVAGDLAGAFSDRPKVRQFVEYLSTGESTRPYLEAGVRVSPHKDSDPNWYPAFFQGYADILADATVVRFDGSDLMPGVVGTGTFWTGMVDWVEGEDLDAVLRAIDELAGQTITVTLDADGADHDPQQHRDPGTRRGQRHRPDHRHNHDSHSPSQAVGALRPAGRAAHHGHRAGSKAISGTSKAFTLTMTYIDADWPMEGIGHEEDLSAFRWENPGQICAAAPAAHRHRRQPLLLQLDHMSESVLGARYPAFLPLVIRE